MQDSEIAQTVALGGVVGATHYYPDLDITAPPRLDLCVLDGDTGFMRQLDASLVPTQNPADKAVLVFHLTRGGDRFVETTEAGRIASPLDCLADLLGMGVVAEAGKFARALNRRAKAMRITSCSR